MDLNLSVSSTGFNGKVSDEGGIEVFVEGEVRNIKRTIGDFTEYYGLEWLKSIIYDGLAEPHSSIP